MRPLKLLVTGVPGIGKTTLVQRVLEALPELRAAGFYTAEERGRQGRTGFKVVTLDGRTGPLARVGEGEGPRVGRYRFLQHAFETLALPALARRPGIDLYVIDEIGKMECLSPAFVAEARTLLAADVPLLATVALRGGGFIAEAKQSPGVSVVTVTHQNRDRLVAELAQTLEQARTGAATRPPA